VYKEGIPDNRKENNVGRVSNDSISEHTRASETIYNNSDGKSRRSPLRWFGGKGLLGPKLMRFIPKHRIYVEPLCGGASLFFMKDKSEVEVLNDLDSNLMKFYRTLQDPALFEDFRDQILLVPYHRTLYQLCRESKNLDNPLVMYILNRHGHGGAMREFSWSFAVRASSNEMSAAVSKWITILQELPIIHNRLKDTILYNKDFREVILEYNNNPDVFFYLDPPYMEETRRKGKYIYEMAREDHKEMLDIIKDSKSMIMLSGYENSLYVDTLPHWRLLKIPVSCSAVGRSRNGGKALGKNGLARFSRIECVWLNPPLINALRGERQ